MTYPGFFVATPRSAAAAIVVGLWCFRAAHARASAWPERRWGTARSASRAPLGRRALGRGGGPPKASSRSRGWTQSRSPNASMPPQSCKLSARSSASATWGAARTPGRLASHRPRLLRTERGPRGRLERWIQDGPRGRPHKFAPGRPLGSTPTIDARDTAPHRPRLGADTAPTPGPRSTRRSTEDRADVDPGSTHHRSFTPSPRKTELPQRAPDEAWINAGPTNQKVQKRRETLRRTQRAR